MITPLAIATTTAKLTWESDTLRKGFAPDHTRIARLNEWIATGLDQQGINVRGSLGDNLLPINVTSYMPDRASTTPKDRELHRSCAHPGKLIAANWELKLTLVTAWSFSVLDEGLDTLRVRTRKTRVPILVSVGEGPASRDCTLANDRS